MTEQQLQCAIATCIVELISTANKLYNQIAPAWLIHETCAYYDSIVGALDGLRLLKVYLSDGVLNLDDAVDLFGKQMAIINGI